MRKLEVLAVLTVLLVVVGLPIAVFSYNGFLRSRHGTEFTLVAAHGTWSPDVIRVKQGERVRLRLTSHDVKHGFALSGYDITITEVYPGKFTIVEFVADKPGEFPFACVVQCDINHARMNGKLVVEEKEVEQGQVTLR